MKVLVVEDNIGIAKMLEISLSKDNFSVKLATDGESGFKMARDGDYDLIVLDLMLPNMSGFEIITGMRALGKKTPILVISARDSVKDRVKALDLGADDYLVKDFALEELSARAKTLIRREKGAVSNILKCKNLSMDLTNMIVMRNGKNLSLTRTEFKLLELLIRKKNKVVLLKDIIEKIWDKSLKEISSNKLNVHLRMLRKKVDEPFDFDLIKTIRGFGYMVTDLE